MELIVKVNMLIFQILSPGVFFNLKLSVFSYLSIFWSIDLSYSLSINLSDWLNKTNIFLAAVVSILLYGYTTWTLPKRMERKLVANYTRMLRAVFSKSWRQHPTKQLIYCHLPPILLTIKVRRTRHTETAGKVRDNL